MTEINGAALSENRPFLRLVAVVAMTKIKKLGE